MSTYEEVVLDLLRNPPDPNEPLPIANRRETIYGVIISFLILSWFAVFFRLWVRFKIVREPGYDDLLVIVAAICNTIAAAAVCAAVNHGLGRHMLYIGAENLEQYLLLFYIANGLYLTETAVIKASLLVQFLRIFKKGAMRWTCVILLVLVSLWGVGFSMIGWVPCLPVRGAWDRKSGAKCYGFGFREKDEFVLMFEAHSASNMAFDIAIFLTPLILFRTPNLKRKNLLAMAGIFAFGAIVVATSVWRLYCISANQAATHPYVDFTFFSPVMIILSSIEIDLAIICASMPIFWPIIEQKFSAIFVSYEVQVVEERVDHNEYGLAYELEHTESQREGIARSYSGTSIEGLTKEVEAYGQVPKYSIGLDPLNNDPKSGTGFQASVQSKPKPKWEI